MMLDTVYVPPPPSEKAVVDLYGLLALVNDAAAVKQRLDVLTSATSQCSQAVTDAKAAQAESQSKIDELQKLADQLAADTAAHNAKQAADDLATNARYAEIQRRENDLVAQAEQHAQTAKDQAAVQASQNSREADLTARETQLASDRKSLDAMKADYEGRLLRLKAAAGL